MNLTELFDLEARLASDRERDDAELRARDREAFAKLAPAPEAREPLVHAWVRALLPKDRESIGERIRSALTSLTTVLVLIGLVLGGLAAAAALYYDGHAPVNVARFVMVLILPQLALVLLTVILLAAQRSSAPSRGLVPAAIRTLWRKIARSGLTTTESADALAALFGHIDARRSLSLAVQRHAIIGLAQVFAIAFNVGALACCLAMVAFTDLQFGWSSTLVRWDSAMAGLVHTLSLPWAALWPEASPSSALVEATRFYRGGRMLEPEVSGRWWPFLVAALAVYGLFPRLLLGLFSLVSLRRALARVPLDTPDIDAALIRMRGHAVSVSGPAPVGPLPTARPITLAEDALAAQRWIAIAWRDFPLQEDALRSAIARALEGTLGPTFEMGGGPDQTRTTLDALPRTLRDGDGVVLLCEAFEPPDRGLRSALAKLREVVGEKRRLVVMMVDRVEASGRFAPASRETIVLWRRTLDALADPYLGLAPLGATA